MLNLLYALDIDHPCAEPWTEPSKYAPDPEPPRPSIFPNPSPPFPWKSTGHIPWIGPIRSRPKMPVPYTTLAETFSYGI